MKCSICSEKSMACFDSLSYCKKHFIDAFEKKAFETIKKYNLIKGKKIAVATSGGKDSTSVLYIVKKYMQKNKLGKPIALLIDEGIKGYREKTLKDLKSFCSLEKIDLRIVSFEKEFGFSLDEYLNKVKSKPCTICGILRRYLLNKYSKGFDTIVTGHNLDDESQGFVMNLFNSDIMLMMRQGIISGAIDFKDFTKRVKPFYFIKEKEILIYSIAKKFNLSYNECPYSNFALRSKFKTLLNEYEMRHLGSKKNSIELFLRLKELFIKNKNQLLKGFEMLYCDVCKEPSSNKVCNCCLIRSAYPKQNEIKKVRT
ncbi:MAG TPA: ATP-binding protein [Candidatus Woesearchaeota archaeon]|nr:ATP-binding protein [Candidatus Woesearchaeota archaeon]